jgi:hypothetical protein
MVIESYNNRFLQFRKDAANNRKDPDQKRIVDKKHAVNDRIRALLDLYKSTKTAIRASRSVMNGKPSPELQVAEKSRITRPLPPQFDQAIALIDSNTNKIVTETAQLLSAMRDVSYDQADYGKRHEVIEREREMRKLQQSSQQTAQPAVTTPSPTMPTTVSARQMVLDSMIVVNAEREEEIVKQASSVLSRLWAHIAAPFSLTEKGRWDRLELLRSCAKMERNMKEVQDLILSGKNDAVLQSIYKALMFWDDAKSSFFLSYRNALQTTLSQLKEENKSKLEEIKLRKEKDREAKDAERKAGEDAAAQQTPASENTPPAASAGQAPPKKSDEIISSLFSIPSFDTPAATSAVQPQAAPAAAMQAAAPAEAAAVTQAPEPVNEQPPPAEETSAPPVADNTTTPVEATPGSTTTPPPPPKPKLPSVPKAEKTPGGQAGVAPTRRKRTTVEMPSNVTPVAAATTPQQPSAKDAVRERRIAVDIQTVKFMQVLVENYINVLKTTSQEVLQYKTLTAAWDNWFRNSKDSMIDAISIFKEGKEKKMSEWKHQFSKAAEKFFKYNLSVVKYIELMKSIEGVPSGQSPNTVEEIDNYLKSIKKEIESKSEEFVRLVKDEVDTKRADLEKSLSTAANEEHDHLIKAFSWSEFSGSDGVIKHGGYVSRWVNRALTWANIWSSEKNVRLGADKAASNVTRRINSFMNVLEQRNVSPRRMVIYVKAIYDSLKEFFDRLISLANTYNNKLRIYKSTVKQMKERFLFELIPDEQINKLRNIKAEIDRDLGVISEIERLENEIVEDAVEFNPEQVSRPYSG